MIRRIRTPGHTIPASCPFDSVKAGGHARPGARADPVRHQGGSIREQVLVVGAGLTGLSAAYHLEQASTPYLLVEATDRPGGWARTDWAEGFGADRAIHALYFRDPSIEAWVGELLDHDWILSEKRCLVDSRGVRTPFPFHANLYGRPRDVIEECLSGMWAARAGAATVQPRPPTFADWIQRHYGAGVARHFMTPYNTKLWTVDPRHMEWDWTGGFVPVIHPTRILAGAFHPLDSGFGLNATFYYPRGGISRLAQAIAGCVRPIRYGTALVWLDPARHLALLGDGTCVRYSWLLSSIPLPELCMLFEPLPPRERAALGRLEGVDLVVVDVGFRGPAPHDVHWVYLPENDVLAYRLHLSHAMDPSLAPPGHGLYCVEVSHSRHRPLPAGTIRNRVVDDLLRTGWLRSRDDVVFCRERRMRSAYVLPLLGYREDAELLRRYLDGLGIMSTGRYGAWKYANMEDALLDGRRGALHIGERGEPAKPDGAARFAWQSA